MTGRTDQRARSRSRLGADFARVWARELHLRNPHAKSVLLAVANYMNEDGSAFPGIGTIARDTDLSEDTVVGRLRWLEKIGAVALFKCWVDENGRRNYDGRGRVTASEIRFLYEADADAIEAAAKEESKPQSLRGAALESAKQIRDQGDASTRQRREQTSVEDPVVSTGLAPGQPPPPAARTEELEQDSPQKPPLANDAASPNAENSGTAYEAFSGVYGEGSVRPEKARALWSVLSERERDLVIRAARAYRAQRQASKKSLMDPERFLRDPNLWSEFASKPASAAKSGRNVPMASAEGRALMCLGKLSGKRPSVYQIGGQETVFTTLDSLSPQLLALGRALDERGAPSGRWKRVGVDSNAFGAWRDLVGRATGLRPYVRYMETSIEVPAEWPPRADGSWPEFETELQKVG